MPPRIPNLLASLVLRDGKPSPQSFDPLARSAVELRRFSTTPSLSKSAEQKKSRAGSVLVLKKKKYTRDARPPPRGERKAIRKRIVLCNTNAFEVPGLQDLTPNNATQYEEISGRVLALPPHLVDLLKHVEAFKAGQGWGLFRRPACLIRREAVHIAQWMDAISGKPSGDSEFGVSAGSTIGRVISGDQKSGKSVLLLQAIANAFLRGWIVIALPEGRDLTNAHTDYAPLSGTSPVQYTQPIYTANLLSQIATANRAVLSQLQTKLQHDIPGVRITKQISLDKLANLGAADPGISWPVFQALWKELMEPTTASAPPSSDAPGARQALHPHTRPPVLLTADNFTHLLVPTDYQSIDAGGTLRPIHPFDFTLINLFMTSLAGRVPFPNGGIVLAATCESGSRKSQPLEVAKAMWQARQRGETHGPLSEELSLPMGNFTRKSTVTIDRDFGGLASAALSNDEGTEIQPDNTKAKIQPSEQKLSEFWSTYRTLDLRVMDMVKGLEFVHLEGISKGEARRVIDYWAGSGMVRRKVDHGWVGERWSLAGGGIIGELEKGIVRGGF